MTEGSAPAGHEGYGANADEGLPNDYIGTVSVLPCHHWHLRPVHSGKKEVTALGRKPGGYFSQVTTRG